VLLVDVNVLMYAAGGPHPYKAPSAAFLEDVADGRIDAAIDAEALQEILHRYRALNRWSEGRQLYDRVRTILPRVIPITAEIVDQARALLDKYSHLMARDALHAAVVQVHSLEGICSFDRDFDRIRGLRRIEPR